MNISARVYVVGDNIDTDQIIPAQHLVYSLTDPQERKKYGEYAMAGLPSELYPAPFVAEGKYESEYGIIIAGKNFGCGSSREHAPACLQIAGVKAVVARSFARIFYRNSINGAFLMPLEFDDAVLEHVKTGDIVELDTTTNTITILSSVSGDGKGETARIRPMGDAGEIYAAGGIFGCAGE